MRNVLFALLLSVLFLFTSCSSLPDSRGAAEEFGWEAAEQLGEFEGAVLAIADLEQKDLPERLYSLFRDDLATALVTSFREEDVNIRVVTRDQVDKVIKEQALELEGLTYRDAQLQVGSLLGADLLVAGTLALLEGDTYRFSGQLLEVSTGTIVGGYGCDFWFDSESGE